MAKTVNMCVRVDPELKAQAEIILEQLGMNMNGTINMFLNQIVFYRISLFQSRKEKVESKG